jgi:hypothetical protein
MRSVSYHFASFVIYTEEYKGKQGHKLFSEILVSI